MEDRRKMELLWLRRLKDAELHLQAARTCLKEAQRHRGAFDVPSPDGNFAFQRALRAENFALAEYHRVLAIFTDLVLRGKVPDEPRKIDGGP